MTYGAGALLVLPDGRIVLQRRTDDAPVAPAMLGTFGGGMDDGEDRDVAVKREIGEEVGLPVDKLTFEYKATITLAAEEEEGGREYQGHMYVVRIPSMDFEVYEGAGAEAFTLEELVHRTDLCVLTKKSLSKIFGGTYGT